jgi:hypothetical protein
MNRRNAFAEKVRIWIYWNEGIARITLHDGRAVTLSSGGRTDEGWSHYSECFEYDASVGLITRNIVTESRDCDGRHGDYRALEWHVRGPTVAMVTFDRLGNPVDLAEVRPEWDSIGSCQRDHAAEAAGY